MKKKSHEETFHWYESLQKLLYQFTEFLRIFQHLLFKQFPVLLEFEPFVK